MTDARGCQRPCNPMPGFSAGTQRDAFHGFESARHCRGTHSFVDSAPVIRDQRHSRSTCSSRRFKPSATPAW